MIDGAPIHMTLTPASSVRQRTPIQSKSIYTQRGQHESSLRSQTKYSRQVAATFRVANEVWFFDLTSFDFVFKANLRVCIFRPTSPSNMTEELL
jgi:hypothetical protein